MVRTPCRDKNGLKKGTWTPEEDTKLMAYVTKYGCWNWRQLPKYAGLSRCGKSCRLRWLNYLRPNIKRGNFSKEEEDTIVRLHESLGNRWSAIAAELPGRTDNDIKNHWHTKLKKPIKKQKLPKQKHINTTTATNNNVNLSSLLPQVMESSSISLPNYAYSSPSDDISTSISTSNITTCLMSNSNSNDDEFAFDSGNFWTQPFISDNDNYYSTPNQFMLPFLDPFCFYPLVDEQIFDHYGG